MPSCFIHEHTTFNVDFTPYDVRWIPRSARLVVLGATPGGQGILKVLEISGTALQSSREIEHVTGFRSGTFGASSLTDRLVATGHMKGALKVWDVESGEAVHSFEHAHDGDVNHVDGFGGQVSGYGPPEVATGGRDGCVRVWDPRVPEGPVASWEPDGQAPVRDCCTVAIGNSYDNEERCVAAGYDNGDVKLFDMRTNSVRWESNVGNGVCGLQFDRRDIKMNKLLACCLESQFHVWDMRTQHATKGFASVSTSHSPSATLFMCCHLPQNRDLFAVGGGDGTVALYRYSYPDQRSRKDGQDGLAVGVAGTVEKVAALRISQLPVMALDWSADKEGLFACIALDQCVRVGIATGTKSV